MSNRFVERVTSAVTTSGGGGGGGDVNVVQEAGIDVAGPISPAVPNAIPANGLFSVGAVQFALLNGDLVALPYYTAGQDPAPIVATLQDALRVKRGETARALHLANAPLPVVAGVAQFTSQAAYSLLPGTARITYWVTYTPNVDPDATNQQVVFVPYWGDGTDEMADAGTNPGVFPPSTVESTLTIYRTTFETPPIQTSDPPFKLAIAMDVPGGATTARLLAKQSNSGDLSAPGSLSIYITTSS